MDLLTRIKEEMLPLAALLGIEFTSASTDRIVARMTVREDLCTRPAVLHGGAVMAFADTLGATGTIVNLPAGATTTTIESKTNFIAPAPVGTQVIGDATPVHRGRRTMIWRHELRTRRAGWWHWSRRPSSSSEPAPAGEGRAPVQLTRARNRIVPPTDGGNGTAVPSAIA